MIKRVFIPLLRSKSDFAKKRLMHANGKGIIYSSVVYVDNDMLLTKSDAILKIAGELNGY